MRRRLAGLAVVPLLLVGATACGDDAAPSDAGAAPEGSGLDQVSVEGEFGSVPEVTVDGELSVEETASEVVIEGDGREVEAGSPVSLHVEVINGKTGESAVGTYEEGGAPLTATMAENQIWQAVLDGVVGQVEGTRVVAASTPEDAFGEQGAQQYGIGSDDSVVFVIDIMSVPLSGPEGAEAELPDGLPTIETDENGNVTGFDFEDAPAEPSDELQVIPVIEGEGDPVEAGDQVTFDYLGQVYGTDNIFDQSYPEAPRTFGVGTGSLIKAWDEGLVGVNTGSRVLIIAPPSFGYGKQGNPQAEIEGTDTLVFVVDILGVS